VKTVITGIHLAETLLRCGRTRPEEVSVLRGGSARGLARVVKLAEREGPPVRWVDASTMQELTGNPSTEIALTLAERETLQLEDALPDDGTSALGLVLEGVEDPHNVGEILRTAWAAGVRLAVLEAHAACLARDVLARSSAGASECLPIVFTDDLVGSLGTLDALSVETVAAMPDASERLFDAAFSERVVVVVGGEHRGLSRHVTDACKRHVTIPTTGEVQSLSATSSAAVILFELVRRGGRTR